VHQYTFSWHVYNENALMLTWKGSVSGYRRYNGITIPVQITTSKPSGVKCLQGLAERDGLGKRAGDGAQTRESLLGRQMVARSPLASCEMALGELLPITNAT
jgi:hypothetical protein